MKNAEPVWDCCKVAFHTNIIDPERIWKRLKDGKFNFPPHWQLSETECSGARSVIVIFDVDGFPVQDDAKAVKRELAKIREPKRRLIF